eukprot:2605461-Amphidinium_carterae.1
MMPLRRLSLPSHHSTHVTLGNSGFRGCSVFWFPGRRGHQKPIVHLRAEEKMDDFKQKSGDPPPPEVTHR